MVVYSKDMCPACDAVKKFLDSTGVNYTVKDIGEDPRYREELIEKGYSSVPVTITEDDETIIGFNLLKLQQVAN